METAEAQLKQISGHDWKAYGIWLSPGFAFFWNMHPFFPLSYAPLISSQTEAPPSENCSHNLSAAARGPRQHVLIPQIFFRQQALHQGDLVVKETGVVSALMVKQEDRC